MSSRYAKSKLTLTEGWHELVRELRVGPGHTCWHEGVFLLTPLTLLDLMWHSLVVVPHIRGILAVEHPDEGKESQMSIVVEGLQHRLPFDVVESPYPVEALTHHFSRLVIARFSVTGLDSVAGGFAFFECVDCSLQLICRDLWDSHHHIGAVFSCSPRILLAVIVKDGSFEWWSQGMESIEVPEGWLQMIRGPRPPAAKWPQAQRMSSAAAHDQVPTTDRQGGRWRNKGVDPDTRKAKACAKVERLQKVINALGRRPGGRSHQEIVEEGTRGCAGNAQFRSW